MAGFAAPHAGGPPYPDLDARGKACWDQAAAGVNRELDHGEGRLDITATYIGSRSGLDGRIRVDWEAPARRLADPLPGKGKRVPSREIRPGGFRFPRPHWAVHRMGSSNVGEAPGFPNCRSRGQSKGGPFCGSRSVAIRRPGLVGRPRGPSRPTAPSVSHQAKPGKRIHSVHQGKGCDPWPAPSGRWSAAIWPEEPASAIIPP